MPPFFLMMKRATLAMMSMVAATALAAAHPRQRPAAASDGAVTCEMRNVVLHLGDGVTLSIHALRGALIPTVKGRPAIFDDRNSFVLRIDGGEVAMSTAALTSLMKNYVFTGDKPPIKKLEITTDDGRLKEKGVLN